MGFESKDEKEYRKQKDKDRIDRVNEEANACKNRMSSMQSDLADKLEFAAYLRKTNRFYYVLKESQTAPILENPNYREEENEKGEEENPADEVVQQKSDDKKETNKN